MAIHPSAEVHKSAIVAESAEIGSRTTLRDR